MFAEYFTESILDIYWILYGVSPLYLLNTSRSQTYISEAFCEIASSICPRRLFASITLPEKCGCGVMVILGSINLFR